MKKLSILGIPILILLIALGINLYFLYREQVEFYNFMVNEEILRVQSSIEGVLAAGGDPVEALSSYIERSRFLKGAMFDLDGRMIIVPGSDISISYKKAEVEAGGFKFYLFFDPHFIKETGIRLTIVTISSSAIMIILLLIIFLITRDYYREKVHLLQQEKERERLESVAIAIHSVLHEVKNSFNTLNMLIYQFGRDPTNKEYKKALSEELSRTNRYIEETANLNKKIELKYEEIELKSLLEEELNKFQAILKDKNIEVELQLEECTIKGDREKLIVIFTNLIKNAIEALSEKEDKRKIRIILKGQRKECVIEIRDSGGKLPDSQSLFKPFITTKERGFGLGLYNVKRYLNAMGGEIEAKVEKGWTIFRVKIFY